LGPVLLDAGLHLLLLGDGEGAALLGLGLGPLLVRVGLVGLELGADVLADVDVGDIDREDLEGGAGVEALLRRGRGGLAGVPGHVLGGRRRAGGGGDARADAGDEGLLGASAAGVGGVGPDGDAGLGVALDAVLGDGVDGRAGAV